MTSTGGTTRYSCVLSAHLKSRDVGSRTGERRRLTVTDSNAEATPWPLTSRMWRPNWPRSSGKTVQNVPGSAPRKAGRPRRTEPRPGRAAWRVAAPPVALAPPSRALAHPACSRRTGRSFNALQYSEDAPGKVLLQADDPLARSQADPQFIAVEGLGHEVVAPPLPSPGRHPHAPGLAGEQHDVHIAPMLGRLDATDQLEAVRPRASSSR